MFTFSLTPPQGPLQIERGVGGCRGHFKWGGGGGRGHTKYRERWGIAGATPNIRRWCMDKKKKGKGKIYQKKEK